MCFEYFIKHDRKLSVLAITNIVILLFLNEETKAHLRSTDPKPLKN